MNIVDLKDEPQHISQIAEWHHNEWSYINPGRSLAKRSDEMKMYLGSEFVPSTFIGKVANDLIGSTAIVECDMDSHEELSPWLASVYVSSEHRGKGYGASLVKHMMLTAQQAGVKTLYLFTPDQASFYKKLGWSIKSQEEFRGIAVTVMEVVLNND